MEQQAPAPRDNHFFKAFLPGLVLGLIVGSLAGAFLPGILGAGGLPELKRPTPAEEVAPRTGPRDEAAPPQDAAPPASTEEVVPPAERAPAPPPASQPAPADPR